jgi:hypothetical protein
MNVQLPSILDAALLAGGGLVMVLMTEGIRARAERQRLATALDAEMLAMWEYYYETVGRPLESWKDGQPLRMPMHPPEDEHVFAVYNASMDKLGLFVPQEAMLLVQAHVSARENIESLRLAAEIMKHDASQHSIDELGRRLQREATQGRETHDKVIQMLGRHARRPRDQRGLSREPRSSNRPSSLPPPRERNGEAHDHPQERDRNAPFRGTGGRGDA